MNLSASYSLAAPREAVFAAITDPGVLQQCIQGCDKMVKTSEDSYDAHLKIGLAGMKGNYVGKVTLRDLHVPISYTLIMEGKGSPGFVKGTAKIRLEEEGEQTSLHCDATAQVGGMIAAVGSRLIQVAAKKMMDDFFRRFGAQLGKA